MGKSPITSARRWLHAIVATGAVLTLAPIPSVTAADLCANIETLVGHAETGFADIVAPAGEAPGGRRVALELTGAERCTVVSQLEGESYHCLWTFPYRAEAASAAFRAFARDIRECLGGGTASRGDSGVNHPDSYDLRLYETGHATVSVSIKDKASLGRTFVFVRVSP